MGCFNPLDRGNLNQIEHGISEAFDNTVSIP